MHPRSVSQKTFELNSFILYLDNNVYIKKKQDNITSCSSAPDPDLLYSWPLIYIEALSGLSPPIVWSGGSWRGGPGHLITANCCRGANTG